jgi:protein translocase SecG subunit
MIIYVILRGLHVLFAITLVAGVMMMQTKSDSGLAGIMGGTGSHTLRGIKGLDENFRVILRWVAIGFLATSFLNAFLA